MRQPVTDAQSARQRFGALLDAAQPPTGGVDAAVIEAEASPVLNLVAELSEDERAGGEFGSFQFRECFTVSTLFGRRLALLDLTPTAALGIVDVLISSVHPPEASETARFDAHLRIAILEGFVLGREERVTEVAAKKALDAVRPLRIDAATFLLAPTGVHEPEALTELVDAFGRAMLDGNASVGIVDLTQLGDPSRERARAVFAAEEVTKMLGASCVFSGVDRQWRTAAKSAGIELRALDIAPTLADGLLQAEALARSAHSEARPKWRALLDRLRR